jgi:RNA polymerase sigma factor (sigma-70 family)
MDERHRTEPAWHTTHTTGRSSRARSGTGETAFRTLYRAYASAGLLDRVQHPARRRRCRGCDAEAFVVAWRKLPGLELAGDSLLPWLATICRFQAANRLRRRQRDAVHTTEAWTRLIPALIDVEQQVIATELADRIAAELEGMSVLDREIFRLCATEGWDYRAAASELGVGHGVVRSRLSRVRTPPARRCDRNGARIMTTTPTELPPLSDEGVDRIEEAVFAQIAEERDAERARSTAVRHRARRRWLTAGGVAAAFVVGVLVTPAILNATGSSPPVLPAPPPPPVPRDLGVGAAGRRSSQGPRADFGGRGIRCRGRPLPPRTRPATSSAPDPPPSRSTTCIRPPMRWLLLREIRRLRGEPAVGSRRPVTTDGGIVPPATGDGWVTLRVPCRGPGCRDGRAAAQGTMLATSVGTNDVTTATTDLRAQIDSLTASVTRLTQLMARGDLGGGSAHRRDRADRPPVSAAIGAAAAEGSQSQVAMSSVQVTLVREAPAAADPAGFGDGLAAGWKGLIISLNALVIALGFLLPWLAVAIVVTHRLGDRADAPCSSHPRRHGEPADTPEPEPRLRSRSPSHRGADPSRVSAAIPRARALPARIAAAASSGVIRAPALLCPRRKSFTASIVTRLSSADPPVPTRAATSAGPMPNTSRRGREQSRHARPAHGVVGDQPIGVGASAPDRGRRLIRAHAERDPVPVALRHLAAVQARQLRRVRHQPFRHREDPGVPFVEAPRDRASSPRAGDCPCRPARVFPLQNRMSAA